MYINKPLLKVEKMRQPSRGSTHTYSSKKKKSLRQANISSRSYANYRKSKITGLNCWKPAMTKSKRHENIKSKSKTTKLLSNAKIFLIKNIKLKNRSFPRFVDSWKSVYRQSNSTFSYVSRRRRKGVNRFNVWKARSRISKMSNRHLGRQLKESKT